MPTVVQEGEFVFMVHTRELPFEPPHVRFSGDEVRIELIGGTFMEDPPDGKRRAIQEAYKRHAAKIRQAWNEIHGSPNAEGDE